MRLNEKYQPVEYYDGEREYYDGEREPVDMQKYKDFINSVFEIREYVHGLLPNKRYLMNHLMKIRDFISKSRGELVKYPSMKLYRFFPNIRSHTLSELKEKAVFVTALANIQSWSKSTDEFWNDLTFGRNQESIGDEVTHPDSVPDMVKVMATIPPANIVLDMEDLLNTLSRLQSVHKAFKDFYLAIRYYQNEKEVFINIQGKEVRVQDVSGYNFVGHSEQFDKRKIWR